MAKGDLPTTLEALVAKLQEYLREEAPAIAQLQTGIKQHQADLTALAPVADRLPQERTGAQAIINSLTQFISGVTNVLSADPSSEMKKQLQAQLETITTAVSNANNNVAAMQRDLDSKTTIVSQKEAVMNGGQVAITIVLATLKGLPEEIKVLATTVKGHEAQIKAALAAGQKSKAFVLLALMEFDLKKLQELLEPAREQHLIGTYHEALTVLSSAQEELRKARSDREAAAQALKAAQDKHKKLLSKRDADIQALYAPPSLPN